MEIKKKRCFRGFADAWEFLNEHDMFSIEIDDEKESRLMKCIHINVIDFHLYNYYEDLKKKYRDRDYAVIITYSSYKNVLKFKKIIGEEVEGPDFESCIIELANIVFENYGDGGSNSSRIIEFYEDKVYEAGGRIS